jgi:hypothetical protein
MMIPIYIGMVGASSLLRVRFKTITHMGIKEQIMAAIPLGTCISAHATSPLPRLIIKKPPMACLIIWAVVGQALLVINIIARRIAPAMVCLIAMNRKGGKCVTTTRNAKYVVPQIIQINASAI